MGQNHSINEGLDSRDEGSAALQSPGVVFSIHGIRTNGDWQNVLDDVMKRSGIHVRNFNYGNFGLSRLMFSRTRRRIAEQFVDWFDVQIKELGTEDLGGPEVKPSVVAHSFGALVVALALMEYRKLKINKLILSGSIVPCNFEWDVLVRRGQVAAVRNEISPRDVWPTLVRCLVSDAGEAGVTGLRSLVIHAITKSIQGTDIVITSLACILRLAGCPFCKRSRPANF